MPHALKPAGWVLVSVLGILMAPLSGCIMSFDGAHGKAEHRWVLSVEPEDDETYVLEAPFLVMTQDTERAVSGLNALKNELAVPPGVQVQWLDDPEGYLRVAAQGPLVLEAKRVFRSDSIGEREAFLEWTIAGETVKAVSGGPLQVVWSVDFSGGKGHTCWKDGEFRTTVPRDGTGSLDYGHGMSAVCA